MKSNLTKNFEGQPKKKLPAKSSIFWQIFKAAQLSSETHPFQKRKQGPYI